jgi:serine/threonine-protein kinase
MELVDGPTLADRIAQGAIPVEEALHIAKQIAEALEAAHEQGIIHRDLKPANIKLRPDGIVKVLDFGLTKALEPVSAGSAGATASPTITSPAMMTGVGMLLGTAAYMSPEQARGKAIDKRTDIWAFGCVLYEMLTSNRAFGGEDVTDTLAAVVRSEPVWNALPAGVSPTVRVFLHRCLQKNAKQRLHDIADMRLALEGAFETGTTDTKVSPPPSPIEAWRRTATVGAAAAIGAALLVGAGVWWTMRPVPLRVVRSEFATQAPALLSPTQTDRDIAITPDGTRIVYVGNNGTQLFVRPIDQLDAIPLGPPGVPRGIFISPDGEWVGYFDVANTMKKVAITGGPAITLTVANGLPRGATWISDDTIVFGTSERGTGLQRVSANGGDAIALTKPGDLRTVDHYWPKFLPGREAMLFTMMSSDEPDASQIAVLDLRTGVSKVVLRGGSDAHYVSSGHLVYGFGGTLRAVPFDLETLEVVGTPIPVVSGVVTKASGVADFSVTANGTLTYIAGSLILAGGGFDTARGELVSVSRQGDATPLKTPIGDYREPRLSPDGGRVAVSDGDNLWAYDLARLTRVRLTPEGGNATRPIWMPDGSRLTFRALYAADFDVYRTFADGSGAREQLLVRPGGQWPDAWSPDGRALVFNEIDQFGGRDLWVLPAEGRPAPLLSTRASERGARFSPDGRWIVYVSNESGRDEVYLQPYPGPGGKVAVSVNGGSEPVWSPAGNELFYREKDRLIAVSVRIAPTIEIGVPRTLFEGDYAHDPGPNTPNYDVFPDGRRFVMMRPQRATPSDQAALPRIILVQNWLEELKRLVPAN